MWIGILELDLRLPLCHSLKDKRQVIKSLVEGTRQRFNVSIAEVDHLDLWQRAGLGVVCVSRDQSFLDQVLNRVEEHIAGEPRIEIIGSTIEFL